MTGALILVCNSRSATLSLHQLDLSTGKVRDGKDLALPVPAGGSGASPMVLGADGQTVYLAWRGADKMLLRFVLDPADRTATLMEAQRIDDDLCYLMPDSAGRRLFATGGDSLVSFALDAAGRLGPLEQRVAVGPLAHSVAMDGQGHVFATACRGDLLRRFAYEPASGHLGQAFDIPQPRGSGPRHLCLSPDRRHLYLVTQESGEVVAFSAGSAPLELQRLAMLRSDDIAPMGGDIAMTGDGRFLYATERSTNQVLAFAVDPASGTLRLLMAAAVPDYPRALWVDPKGRFVVCLGFRGHAAMVFAIGTDGALTPMVHFDTGERPSAVLAVDLP